MDTRTGNIYEYADRKAREQAIKAKPALTPINRSERRKLASVAAADRPSLLNELQVVAHNACDNATERNAAKRARKARR